jgi:transcriptional regulator of acetoin/glycerol metabolism
MNPSTSNVLIPALQLPEEYIENENANREFLDVAGIFVDMLFDSLNGSDCIVSITDSHGVILKSWASAVLDISSDGNTSYEPLLPGTRLSEEYYGLTAIGQVVKNKKPCQVIGAEHQANIFRGRACFAAPVLSKDQNLAGIFCISCKCELVDRYLLAVAASTAKAIEKEMVIRKISRELIENSNQTETALSAVSDGVVYAKDDRIIQINKAMSEFLGRPIKEVTGQMVSDIIITFPSIEEAMNRTNSDSYVEIMITGTERNYNCLLNIRPIEDAENGYVMVFTRTDEIQMLARKINRHNAFFTFEDIKGNSFGIKEAITLAKKASEYNFRIIIEGESGTGKEMFAQAIHNNSARKHKPFIAFDCGATPHQLVEGELFGYARTDILQSGHTEKPGKFELANGGTLFIDDITNMPMEVQAKMLRILQEEKIIRIGGTEQIPLDVRIIAASNANLDREVKNGNFRRDLFYRLNVVFIRIPPLRERKEDIPVFIDYFLNKSDTGNEIAIEKKAMGMLESYHWPGNVRELHNAVERAAMVCEGSRIKKEDFALNIMDPTESGLGKSDLKTMDEQMKNYAIRVLDYTGGNISEASRILDISRVTIYKILNSRVGE